MKQINQELRMKKRKFSSVEKVKAVKRHLVDKETVSAVCESLGIGPNLFYKWQQQLFSEGSKAFEKESKPSQVDQAKVTKLEATLQQRESALAELLTDHIKLKKKWNGDL